MSRSTRTLPQKKPADGAYVYGFDAALDPEVALQLRLRDGRERHESVAHAAEQVHDPHGHYLAPNQTHITSAAKLMAHYGESQ